MRNPTPRIQTIIAPAHHTMHGSKSYILVTSPPPLWRKSAKAHYDSTCVALVIIRQMRQDPRVVDVAGYTGVLRGAKRLVGYQRADGVIVHDFLP